MTSTTRTRSGSKSQGTPATPKSRQKEEDTTSLLRTIVEEQKQLRKDLFSELHYIKEGMSTMSNDLAKLKVHYAEMKENNTKIENMYKSLEESMPSKIREEILKDRKRSNLMVFGLAHTEYQLNQLISDLLEFLTPGCQIPTITKLNNEEKSPVRLEFKDVKERNAVLNKAANLRSSDKFKTVFITPDLTLQQRKVRKECIELKSKMEKENPSKKYVIRGNNVVEKDFTNQKN